MDMTAIASSGTTGSSDFLDSTGYHRPRRPDLDTIAYLKGLPLHHHGGGGSSDDDPTTTTSTSLSPHQEIQRYLVKEMTGQIQDGDDKSNNNMENDKTIVGVNDDEMEFPSMLAAALSALDEISNEVASLAGDEIGSQSLETIARLVVPYSGISGRILLNACTGYCLHLATHRYGSHVLQTLLQLSVYQYRPETTTTTTNTSSQSSASVIDLALHDDAPGFSTVTVTGGSTPQHNIPPLKDIIMTVVDELAPHATQLAVHVCGSHVLRTLLCVLGGVDLLPSGPPNSSTSNGIGMDSSTMMLLRGRPKSKKKKKKKKRYDPETGNELPSSSSSDQTNHQHHAGLMTVVYRPSSRTDPQEFESTLHSLSNSLLGIDNHSNSDHDDNDGPGELQQLVCHASAGPLFIVMLRVLTYTSESARKQWLQLNTEHDDIADFRLGIVRTEPRYEIGSNADKAVRKILCWQSWKDNVDETSSNKKQDHVGDVLYGLSGETRGSHILETILRLCPDDFYTSIIEYGDFLTPSSLQEYIDHDVSNFVIQTMISTVRSQEQAGTVLKALEGVITNGFVIDPNNKRRAVLWRATELAAKYRIGQKDLLESIQVGFAKFSNNGSSTSTTLALDKCVPRLIDFKEDSVLDVAGCRSVYHMLRFSPSLCEPVLEGIIKSLPTESLVMIAKDGLGSRCIIDGILDGPTLTPIFARASKQLWEKLRGHWGFLATHRVGHHTVKKMFKALPKIDDKAKLVDELYNAGNRLSGNAMGRSVIETCHVNEYGENRAEWRKLIVKSLSKHNDNFVETLSSKQVTNDDEKDESGKKKRKRKRKKSGGIGDENDTDNLKKQQKSKDTALQSSSVDSIMKLMYSGK